MTDHDALLAGVLAHPDADLPRLVYADFIEEAGDAARAEFIRVQCALTAGHFEDEKEKAALELRERYLREKHAPSWLAPLKNKGEPLFTPRSHGLFRRGFVECVWMPAAWFVAKAEKLFARCPVNELRVTMTTAEEYVRLVNSPHFLRLRTLDVSERRLGDSVFHELLYAAGNNPLVLSGLKRLRVRGCGVTWHAFSSIESFEPWQFDPDELDVGNNDFDEYTLMLLVNRYGDALKT